MTNDTIYNTPLWVILKHLKMYVLHPKGHLGNTIEV